MFIQINPACISLPDRALPCIFDLEQKEIHKHYMFICFAAYSLATLKVGSYPEKHTSWYVSFWNLRISALSFIIAFCTQAHQHYSDLRMLLPFIQLLIPQFIKILIRLLSPSPHIMLIQEAQEF